MDLKVLDLKPSALEIIERHFQKPYSGELGLSSIKGGQSAANLALSNLDITRYAEQRSEVLPLEKRGAAAEPPCYLPCAALRIQASAGRAKSLIYAASA